MTAPSIGSRPDMACVRRGASITCPYRVFCVQDKLEGKAPFSQYSSLSGANVVWGNPTDASSYPSDQFDIVYDNNGKDLDTCKIPIDHFKVCSSLAFQLLSMSLLHSQLEQVSGPRLSVSQGCKMVARPLGWRRYPSKGAILQDKVSHYAFVGSAGAYKANKVEPVLTESDPRKDSAGHVAVEKYLEEQVCRKPSAILHATAKPAGRALLLGAAILPGLL